jgi:hypothetical protein
LFEFLDGINYKKLSRAWKYNDKIRSGNYLCFWIHCLNTLLFSIQNSQYLERLFLHNFLCLENYYFLWPQINQGNSWTKNFFRLKREEIITLSLSIFIIGNYLKLVNVLAYINNY